ncbi:transposase [Pseudomonas sp. CrR25]|nr:transposase [Pseudomonas sp. CrR25]
MTGLHRGKQGAQHPETDSSVEDGVYGALTLLRRHRIVPSHSWRGNCWDNAATESFFRSLKAKRVYLTRYTNYQKAKIDLFNYIRFYNHRRRHLTLDYLRPMEFERRNASSSS